MGLINLPTVKHKRSKPSRGTGAFEALTPLTRTFSNSICHGCCLVKNGIYRVHRVLALSARSFPPFCRISHVMTLSVNRASSTHCFLYQEGSSWQLEIPISAVMRQRSLLGYVSGESFPSTGLDETSQEAFLEDTAPNGDFLRKDSGPLGSTVAP